MLSSNENKRYKSDEKEEAAKQTDKQHAIHITEEMLGLIAAKPKTWNDPDLEVVKSLICRIGLDKVTYPPPAGEDDGDSSMAVHPLSQSVQKVLHLRCTVGARLILPTR